MNTSDNDADDQPQQPGIHCAAHFNTHRTNNGRTALFDTFYQGCSLGLERLGLETVSRRLFERLGLVSVSASYVFT